MPLTAPVRDTTSASRTRHEVAPADVRAGRVADATRLVWRDEPAPADADVLMRLRAATHARGWNRSYSARMRASSTWV
jgi:hypothetical protein